MPMVVTKKPTETWREAVARIAGAQGLAAECLAIFDSEAPAHGEPLAAWHALYEWDCLDYVPDSSEKKH